MTSPSTGRIVHYKLTEGDVDRIETLRLGTPRSRGNKPRADQVVPLIVVVAHDGGKVSGQAFLDGNDNLWVTSAAEGEGRGQWSWPPRV
jgi:hypothetical protein